LKDEKEKGDDSKRHVQENKMESKGQVLTKEETKAVEGHRSQRREQYSAASKLLESPLVSLLVVTHTKLSKGIELFDSLQEQLLAYGSCKEVATSREYQQARLRKFEEGDAKRATFTELAKQVLVDPEREKEIAQTQAFLNNTEDNDQKLQSSKREVEASCNSTREYWEELLKVFPISCDSESSVLSTVNNKASPLKKKTSKTLSGNLAKVEKGLSTLIQLAQQLSNFIPRFLLTLLSRSEKKDEDFLVDSDEEGDPATLSLQERLRTYV